MVANDDQPDEARLRSKKCWGYDQDHATWKRNAGSFDQRRPEDDAKGVIREKTEMRLKVHGLCFADMCASIALEDVQLDPRPGTSAVQATPLPMRPI
jgi:hypothetical protein